MLELLLLLLPVAAGYGWYMGQRSAAQSEQQSKHKLRESYVEGLNYLLTDQSDKAVDLFIDLIKVDEQTIETHLALASLFRHRGESDRAIKLHQNLVSRKNLSQEQHEQALYELALDFMAAGILDRAEQCLLKLQRSRIYSEKAIRQLVNVYQQLQQWPQAIKYSEKLPVSLSGNKTIAEYYCLLAEQHIEKQEIRAALKALKKALQSDADCVHASLTKARLYVQRGHIEKAIRHYSRILEQDIDLVSEILPELRSCFDQTNPDGWHQFLLRAVEKGAGASAVNALADLLIEKGFAEDAEQLELSRLRTLPSLRGFYHYMGHHVRRAETASAQESLAMLQQLVSQQIRVRPRYRCRSCGFSCNTLQWRCPSCKSWAQIKPIRGLDGE